MKIFLLGFMGSGKTTLGKKLASKLNLDFYDLDKLVETKYNKSINRIFDDEGEESFRNMEHLILREISLSDNFILSTGGGTPCYNNNMELINSAGISVYLQMTSNALFSRLVKSRAKRPLIKNLDDGQLKNYITETLFERETFYLKANITINAISINIKKLFSELGL